MPKQKKVQPAEVTQPDPMDQLIQVPTRDLEALFISVLGGNRTAAVDVVNRIREIAEKQNPTVFNA
jgi:hypothetical protein